MILQMSLVLLVSYVLFTLWKILSKRIGVILPSKKLLRLAQALVLLSLVLPVSFQALPDKHLPELNFHPFRPYRELSVPGTRQNVAQEKIIQIKSFTASNSTVMVRFLERLKELPENFPLILWGLIFVLILCRMIFSWRTLFRKLDQSIVLKKVGSVRIVLCEGISVPFSARFFKTKWVAIPGQMIGIERDTNIAIKHELQHHRQLDTVWAVWIEVLKCLFFFHPAIYGWKQSIIELQEFSCDEALTGQDGFSLHEYGSCLLRVAEAALENRKMYVGTTCMAAVSKNPKAVKSFLTRRIEMMMQDKKSSKRNAMLGMGVFTTLFTVLTAYGLDQTNRIEKHIQVTVDPSIQKIADQTLNEAIKLEGAQAGFAIVADPKTGRVLAVANVDLKNNKKNQWALTEKMEPASLMKGILTAEAIEKNVTTAAAEHQCENGTYQYEGQVFHDWKKEGWEKLTTTETVANSSDICSLKIAEELGNQKLHDLFTHYGFGTVGSDALIAPAAAYGMGFQLTPLEVIQAYGAIANGGNLLVPQFADHSTDSPQVVRRVLSTENSEKMRTILQEVVISGTARKSASKIYTTAGKTESSFTGGITAGDPTGSENKSDIAGFVGFAPAKEPRIEIYVAIFSPKGPSGASGAAHAAPVFTQLTDRILKYLNVSPDKGSI